MRNYKARKSIGKFGRWFSVKKHEPKWEKRMHKVRRKGLCMSKSKFQKVYRHKLKTLYNDMKNQSIQIRKFCDKKRGGKAQHETRKHDVSNKAKHKRKSRNKNFERFFAEHNNINMESMKKRCERQNHVDIQSTMSRPRFYLRIC